MPGPVGSASGPTFFAMSEGEGLTMRACALLPRKSKHELCANGKTCDSRGTGGAGSPSSPTPPMTYMTPPRETMRWCARGTVFSTTCQCAVTTS